MEETNSPKKIIIVGGGFGGVRAALDLAQAHLLDVKIILISDKPHFEYHAALYRIVTGHSPLEVCIPLIEIFKGKEVEVVEDTVTNVDLKEKKLVGSSGSHYIYDYLVLALGSETSYPDIEGLREFSFGFKSIGDALKLKRHIHEMFSSCVVASDREKECALRFVIVGGGASGTELASELAVYTRKLAVKHKLDAKLITIDIIDAHEKILSFLPTNISEMIMDRLKKLGIGILLNNRLIKEEVERVYLKDMEMRTKTVIWTAGVVPNHLYKEIDGLSFDEKRRVIVDEYLSPSKYSEVFIIGDAAATVYTGMAQTAVDQGVFVAKTIGNKLRGEVVRPYVPKKPFYAIPIGPNWAYFLKDSVQVFGPLGWWLRRLSDLMFFLSILPLGKALLAFRSDKVLWESCPICSK